MPDEQLAGPDAPVVDNEAQNLQPEQPGTETTGTAEAQTDGAEGSKDSPAQQTKTFSQEEVNAIVAREKAREARRAFRELQRHQAEQTPQPKAPAESDPVAIAREIAAVERFTEKCNAIAAEGAKKFPDFNEALTAFTAEVGPIADRNGKPTAIGQVLLEAESPAEVLRYLGKNPDVAADLADLTPTQLARRMDRIERDMKEAAKPKVSNAPKPLKPVTGGGTAVKDPSQMSDAEWREWRLANK